MSKNLEVSPAKEPTVNNQEAKNTGLAEIPKLEEPKPENNQKGKNTGDDSRKILLRKFTGGGFYPSSNLVRITDSYQNRTKCEEVDLIESLNLDTMMSKL